MWGFTSFLNSFFHSTSTIVYLTIPLLTDSRLSSIFVTYALTFFCDGLSGIVLLSYNCCIKMQKHCHGPSEQLCEFILLQQEYNFSYYFCLFLLFSATREIVIIFNFVSLEGITGVLNLDFVNYDWIYLLIPYSPYPLVIFLLGYLPFSCWNLGLFFCNY